MDECPIGHGYIGSSLSQLSGLASAETEEDYLVLTETPNIAVVRIYNDKVLAVSFDRERKIIGSEVMIRKLDKEEMKLTLHKGIGPLTRK